MCLTAVVGESPVQGSGRIGAVEEGRNSGMCSTSGSSHLGTNGVHLSGQLLRVDKDTRTRRRWRGRKQPVFAGEYVETLWAPFSEISKSQHDIDPQPAAANEVEGSAMIIDAQNVIHYIPELGCVEFCAILSNFWLFCMCYLLL